MSRSYRPLAVEFYRRDAETVARALLGTLLVSECGGMRCVGRIVETEAYPGPHDPASHAAATIGRTERNAPMFGSPGTVYIHLNYGIHWCLNVVVEREGFPAAVLVRALEPVEGEQTMASRRGRQRIRDLCSGPAKLTQALGIGPELQGHDLREPPLVLARGELAPSESIVQTTRVGISRGRELEWRYYDRRSDCVSRR